MPYKKVLASAIIKIIPYIYIVSPSTGREYQLRITDYLSLHDALAFLNNLGEEYEETPKQTIEILNLHNLLEIAQDWRFMEEDEIVSFVARDIDQQKGYDPYCLDVENEVVQDDE